MLLALTFVVSISYLLYALFTYNIPTIICRCKNVLTEAVSDKEKKNIKRDKRKKKLTDNYIYIIYMYLPLNR